MEKEKAVNSGQVTKPGTVVNGEIVKSEKAAVSNLPEKPAIIELSDFNSIVAKAEAEVEAIKKIKIISLRSTNEGDWVNHNGVPYLEVMGSMKIAQIWGISILDMIQETIKMSDASGEYYVVRTSGKAKFREREIVEIGTCTSRDDFFGKKDKKFKAIEDVSFENVAKASATNFHNRILKKILGLSPTWADMAAAGLKQENIKSINNKESKATPEDQAKQSELRAMMREMYGDAEHLKKLIELSAFVNNKTKAKVDGVKSYEELAGIRLKIMFEKITVIHANWKKDMADQKNDAIEPPPDESKQNEPEPGPEEPKKSNVEGSISVEQAIQAKTGLLGNLKGIVSELTVRKVGKKQSELTDFIIYDVNEGGEVGIETILISLWGNHSDKVHEGEMYIFTGIIKSVYNDQTQYMAKSYEVAVE